MENYDAIIIGGGLGGLTAGAVLAKAGRKVLVVERHRVPGGCASSFRRKDYVVDVGLHEINGVRDEKDIKTEIFSMLGIDKNIRFVQAPEFFRAEWGDGGYTFPHGNEESKNKLIEQFPDERRGIERFYGILAGVAREKNRIPRGRWKKLLMLPLFPFLIPNLFTASRCSVGHWLDRHIADDKLKLLLLTNSIYYGDDPYDMSLLYFAAGQSSYIKNGGYYINGGSQKLSNYLADFIERRGGRVLTGKRVERILTENDRACGVGFRSETGDGGERISVAAKVVIAAAAVPLIADMLPGTAGLRLRNRIKHLKNACSIFSVYLGFNADLSAFGVEHYSTFFRGEGVAGPKDIAANNRGEWSKRAFVFVDYGKVDSGLTPPGKSFAAICSADYADEWEGLDKNAYNAKKKEVADIFLEKLERRFPGIMSSLEYCEVATALTIRRYTLNPDGTPYGYAQSVAQSGRNRIQARSPVKNLYFASAWSFPGGGFSGVMTGGFLCAAEVMGKLKSKK
jgi:phytoene dehydrogenase-like protein